ncbi:hypothetical protein [Methylobacterium haplocladii]|uniref:Uncharacterized protein n=1 Tax=Methylobacterium haplocladii TaxID=1176176 RepID=A0A512IVX1_9HYPH|nr:hypothetical protein [Methylobacterium haplocladii]GEP01851.1 hypothetical protein MHA02_42380 [Methylobacterium haplocladii]GJD83150.1 hypothetical protein HPGCJGGD_1013 [Methylobacterium haplocladii]GLS61506.1 hypothetical protein GCM10007887_42200 [Methylobacterium haplocladii]
MPIANTTRLARTKTVATAAVPDRPAGSRTARPALSFISLSERPDGARLVLSPCSPLVVGIAPLDELALLRNETALARLVAYSLIHRGEALGECPELRPGETVLMPARMARHRARPPLPIEEVVLIGSNDLQHFGESALLALQEALHRQARRAGRARVVGGEPQQAWLTTVEPVLVARWLHDLRFMLMALGCPYLEPRRAVLQPRAEPLPLLRAPVALTPLVPAPVPVSVPSGYALDLPDGLAARADARRYSLDWRGLRASAVVAGGWTVLKAGSQLIADDRGGIQACLSRKRRTLQEAGLVRRVGRTRLRLLRDLGLPSLVNATRVITGGNESDGLWTEH